MVLTPRPSSPRFTVVGWLRAPRDRGRGDRFRYRIAWCAKVGTVVPNHPQGAEPGTWGGLGLRRLPASLSKEALRDTWRSSRDSRFREAGAAGIDQVRASTFGSQLDEQIERLRRDVRSDGFRFSRLRIAPIPKANGGHRIIAVPTVRDRLLQRALLRHLENDSRFRASSEVSYGFTKGRTLPDAQRAALRFRSAKPWVVKADIIKFFDRIRRDDIKKIVLRKVRSKTIARLLCAAIDCELEEGSGPGAQIAREAGIRRGLGLRQGMPVSPMLSNLLLQEFDDVLLANGLSAVRYADDIAVFCESKKECLTALEVMKNALDRVGLMIPEIADAKKTMIAGPSNVIEFLGVEIRRFPDGYKLCAPSGKIKKIEDRMAELASISKCVAEKRNIGQLVRTMESFIMGHYASMAVLDNPAEFLGRLEAAKRRHLEALLVSLIGKDAVKALDPDRRAILGLQPF